MADALSPLPAIPALCGGLAPITSDREAELRQRLVARARAWLRTPYVQQGAILGAGVDCSMLLVRVWVEAGIVEEFDPRPYPPSWHMHHSEERYLAWMDTLACRTETPQAGDIALFRFGRCFSHGGVMIAPDAMISASSGHGRVVASDLDEAWLRWDAKSMRPRLFFDIFARLRQLPGA